MSNRVRRCREQRSCDSRPEILRAALPTQAHSGRRVCLHVLTRVDFPRHAMLTKAQLAELFDRLGTPPAGQKFILNARIQAPVREVKSQGGNVITILASQKM